MRIAIAADGDQVSHHFRRCERYEVVEFGGKQIVRRESLPNPGQEPGRLARVLRELGVDTVVAAEMGPRAQDIFLLFGVVTVTGVSGSVSHALSQLTAGYFKPAASTWTTESR